MILLLLPRKHLVMSFKNLHDIKAADVIEVAKKARCIRQLVAILELCPHPNVAKKLMEMIDRYNQDNQSKIDISHFNIPPKDGEYHCQDCGQTLKVMTTLDFDDIAKPLGNCKKCKKSEWLSDNGPWIDAFHYFQTLETKVIGEQKGPSEAERWN